jgi:pilus assembly protein CpaB
VRRTSRLVLLLGIFLAALTFVVVLVLGQGGGTGPGPGPQASAPTTADTLIAAVDIPLGTVITEDQVAVIFRTETLPVTSRKTGAYGAGSQAIGQTTRATLRAGQQVGSGDFQNRAIPLEVPPGERAFAIQVNELTGVGNLVDVGDNIDLIISLSGGAFPVVQVLDDGSVTVVAGINPLSVKLPLLLQDVQIIGTIAQAAPAPAEGTQGQPAASAPPTISGASKILILSVTPAQAEVLLFARTSGTLDVILRSPADAGQTADTTGVILKTLVDDYGILPPEIVQIPIPTPLQNNNNNN